MIIHRFALAKSGPGMAKICLLNSAAKDFINKFLADYKDALTTTIKASLEYRFERMQDQIKKKKKNQKSLDASHGSSSKSATKSAGSTPPKQKKRN